MVVVAAGRPADRAWMGEISQAGDCKMQEISCCVTAWCGDFQWLWETKVSGLLRVIVDTELFGVCLWCCLLAQVLHLQNKQAIVVSATVVSLPPSAQSALLGLCIYSFLPGWRCRVFFFSIQTDLQCLLKDTSIGYFVCCCIYLSLLLSSYCFSFSSLCCLLLFMPFCWLIVTTTLCLSGQWWSVLVRACSRGCLLRIRTTPLTGWQVTMRTMRANRSLTVPESRARQRLWHPPAPPHTWARLTAAAAGAARWRRATVAGARSGRPPVGDLPPAAQRHGTAPLDCTKHNKEKKRMAKTVSKHWRDLAAPQRRSARNGSSFPARQRRTEISAVRWAARWLMSVSHTRWLTASAKRERALYHQDRLPCWFYWVSHTWHIQ